MGKNFEVKGKNAKIDLKVKVESEKLPNEKYKPKVLFQMLHQLFNYVKFILIVLLMVLYLLIILKYYFGHLLLNLN